MELVASLEAVKRFDQKIHDESGRDWTWFAPQGINHQSKIKT
jgi:hypothetical protein